MKSTLATDFIDLKEIKEELSRRFPGASVPLSAAPPRRLRSCIEEVDTFLDGGLPFNGVTEFGMPLGKEGRLLLLRFLVNATRGLDMDPIWTLWVSSHSDFRIFPPAWFARGVAPSRIVFTQSQSPAHDLKRAIINPFFKLIVLDSPRHFSRDDCFFINTQARHNQQLILLLRNFFLSNKQGNVWAKLRFNCWKQQNSGRFILRTIRGLPRCQVAIHEGRLT